MLETKTKANSIQLCLNPNQGYRERKFVSQWNSMLVDSLATVSFICFLMKPLDESLLVTEQELDIIGNLTVVRWRKIGV